METGVPVGAAETPVIDDQRARFRRRLTIAMREMRKDGWLRRVCLERRAHCSRRRSAASSKLSCVYDFIKDPLGIISFLDALDGERAFRV